VAANKRVFYAIYKAGFAPVGSTAFVTAHGMQSCNITTTFNLEQVFEIGQITIYENIEGIPDVEVSCEKVLDGWPPLYLLSTSGATAATLLARSKIECTMGLAIYSDANDPAAATGTPVSEVHMSGLYVGSIGYEVTTDGNATETTTFLGNNKIWVGTAGEAAGSFDDGTHWDGSSAISTATDRPYSISGSGGVNRAEDVLFGSGNSIIPLDIPGIEELEPGSGYNVLGNDGNYGAHIQRIAVNVDFGRENMFELGRRGVYYKYATFPVEVTTEVVIMSVSGDMVSASEDGLFSEGACGRYNLVDRSFRLNMCEGLVVDCGNTNKLASIGVTGGDTGGANREITYTYSNFNTCTVTHPRDPTVALRP
jgi:hypothetical protein